MMIRNIAILCVLMALTAAYTWYDSGRDLSNASSTPAAPVQGDAQQIAPDFPFTDIEGNKHNLSDFRGKVVVLNFWATWCAPCVSEFPQMIALAKDTRKQSVFLFISQDMDDPAITRFLKKYAPERSKNVIVARDEGMRIAQKSYQTFKLPETYLITPDGRIAEKIIGADVQWDGKAMRDKIGVLGR